MTERIDHAAKACVLERNAWVRGGVDGDRLIRRPEERRDMIASAQVHATLALVEQQRIANVVSIMSLEVQEDKPIEQSEATTALYSAGRMRPDFAEALGIDEVQS